MSFVQRNINLSFQLGTGDFGDTGMNTMTVSGLRVHADITEAAGPQLGQAHIDVYGLPLSTMQQLSSVVRVNNGMPLVRFNNILVAAGDAVAGMSQIFQGLISNAVIDMQAEPAAALRITATAGGFEAVEAATPTSYPGGASVAVIMQNLATKMGYAFENNGITTVLSRPYFKGSLLEQMQACAEAAYIEAKITDGVLAIWPKGGARGGVIPFISPATGMIGYPANYDLGVAVRAIFTPSLKVGGQVKVQSSLAFANGIYNIFDIAHELESETPGGSWFSSFKGQPFNVG